MASLRAPAVIHSNADSSSLKTADPSAPGNANGLTRCSGPVEWYRLTTIEERNNIRGKIKAAYLKKIGSSFDDLLDTCVAIEEEVLLRFTVISTYSNLIFFVQTVAFL